MLVHVKIYEYIYRVTKKKKKKKRTELINFFITSTKIKQNNSNFVRSNFWTYLYLPNPSARTGYDTRSIFKRSLTGLNSEFSFF